MRKTMIAAASALAVAGVSVWTLSASLAANAAAEAASIDVYRLHAEANVSDMPNQTVEDIN